MKGDQVSAWQVPVDIFAYDDEMGPLVRARMRQRVLIAAGELNFPLDRLDMQRVADELVDCAMEIRNVD